MNPETENQRNSRIRDAQIQGRTGNNPMKASQNVVAKKRSAPAQANEPSGTAQTGPLNLPLGGVRDIAIGVAYGLIPAVLVALLLPGALKLVALLVLIIAGAVGYLLGTAT